MDTLLALPTRPARARLRAPQIVKRLDAFLHEHLDEPIQMAQLCDITGVSERSLRNACHAVRGTDAAGIYGPDLTHFASRPTIAAGVLPNTVAGRVKWLADTQGVKPGAAMPQVPLDPADRVALVQYLGTLR